MFKSQLQEFAQKAGWPAPVYNIMREGSSHEPKFKAVVTIQNEVYESPAFFHNLKKAEQAAAEVALMAVCSKPGSQTALPNPLHESGLCKNLLQEYAQKCKLPIPIYTLAKSGYTHSPMFTASVEIAGVQYKGGLCKSKKEAEIKAAKTALIAICSDLGGSPEQAFENRLSCVGTPEVSAVTAVATEGSATKPALKRRNKHRFPKGRFKRRKKAQQEKDGNDGGEQAANKDDRQQQADAVAPELLDINIEIPGITQAN